MPLFKKYGVRNIQHFDRPPSSDSDGFMTCSECGVPPKFVSCKAAKLYIYDTANPFQVIVASQFLLSWGEIRELMQYTPTTTPSKARNVLMNKIIQNSPSAEEAHGRAASLIHCRNLGSASFEAVVAYNSQIKPKGYD